MKKVIMLSSAILMSLVALFSGLTFNLNSIVASADDYSAKSVLLMDADSGQILFEKDKNQRLPIASMTKLMTILLTMESIDSGNLTLDTKVVASKHAAGMGGSQVFLDAGSEYTVGDLLKSAIVASANDASVALSETISGSESEFVNLMNKRANELGMKDTNYQNATGLPMPNAYSSAFDSATLMREVLTHPIYFDYSTIWMDELTHPSGRVTELTNTNRLIRYYDGCDAGKTGSTNEAGYCVTASAKKNDLRLISVVIGAKTGAERFSQAGTLLDYGFANYVNEKLYSMGQEIEQEISISHSKIKSFKPIVEKDCYVLKHKGDSKDITVDIKLDEVKTPLNKGDKVGTIYVVLDGVVINEVALLTPCDISTFGIFDAMFDIINNWKITK